MRPVVKYIMPKHGFKQSAEHIAKRIKRGEDHPHWKGGDITVKGGRTRALRMYPVIGPCELCGSPDSERHHLDGNTANNDHSNIAALCRKCHMTKDGRLSAFQKIATNQARTACSAAALSKRNRTSCKRGHLLTGGNLYTTRSGRRVCKECRKIHKARYRANGGK